MPKKSQTSTAEAGNVIYETPAHGGRATVPKPKAENKALRGERQRCADLCKELRDYCKGGSSASHVMLCKLWRDITDGV